MDTFFWRNTDGLFRPRFTKPQKVARREATDAGRRVRDPRAGHPTHRTDHVLTADEQRRVARELGYRPHDAPHNAQQSVFHNPDGHPPYISYDRTGHGTIDRTGGGEPPKVAWKGADNPMGFGARQRAGTYNPVYDENGNIIMDRARR